MAHTNLQTNYYLVLGLPYTIIKILERLNRKNMRLESKAKMDPAASM